MKHFLNLITFLLFSSILHAQVGINNTDPKASLDISASDQANPSNTDGLLIPRIDDFPAIDPTAAQEGMMVYLTTTSGGNLPGFYYWNNSGGSWTSAIGGSGSVLKIDDLSDGKSDSDGSNDGSSVFLGVNAGVGDDSTDNKNVGIGFESSLANNSTGSGNTAIGYQSLRSNLASNNTAIGRLSLFGNSTGSSNTAIGSLSLRQNFSGVGNSAHGSNSLISNVLGSYNTALGSEALGANVAGSKATAVGSRAMYYSNDTGTAFDNFNVALGFEALRGSTNPTNNTGNNNTALGYQSLFSNTTGNSSTATGYSSLFSNTTGSGNTANGNYSLYYNTTGSSNLANGYQSLLHNTTGIDNTANGHQSLFSNTTGWFNTANGYRSLYLNTTGSSNIANGFQSLYSNTVGNNNIAMGYQSGYFETSSNTLYIENTNADSNNALIYGEFGINNTTTGNILRTNSEFQIGNPTGTGYAFPTTDGSANQVMKTDGSGAISWVSPSSGTDDQTVDQFNLVGTTLGISLEDDGAAPYTVDLSPLQDGTGTDDQTVDLFNLVGTTLGISLEDDGSTPYTVDLSSLQDGTGTDDQNISGSGLSGTDLTIGIENGTNQVIDLSSLAGDDDWTDVSTDIERQSGNVYIGDTNATNNDIYISDRIIDWDSTSYYLDPDDISKVDEIEFDSGGSSDPSVRFSDADTGFYSPSVATTAYSANGTESFRINSTGDISIGSTSNLNYKLLIENPVSSSNIYIGSKSVNDDVMKIDHNGQRGDGLQVNVTNGYTLASKSAFAAYNAYPSVTTNIARYVSGSRIYGVENSISGNIGLPIYGVYNYITNSSSSTHYGTQNRLLGSGSGFKYGTYNYIPSSAGGTHYGVYSYVPKASSYAGYFLGRVSIGTSTSNTYILPSSRGTNGQVMQTDGSGNISWSTLSTSTDDQNISGSGLSGTDLTIGIESGTNQVIDLSSLQDGIGTDDQDITSATLTGTSLAIVIENGTGTSVDLSPLQDADWFETGGTPPNSISDDIYTNGNVGIGVNLPTYKLDVRKTEASDYIAQILNYSTNTTADALKIKISAAVPNTSNNFIGFFNGSDVIRGKITGTVAGVNYATTSDRRLKTKIINIDNALNLIENIQPRKYEYKSNLGTEEYGFIAQELQLIYPQAVIGSPDSNAETDPMMVDYSRLTPLLTAGIKELNNKVVILETENKKLKQKLSKYNDLEARLIALENKVYQPTTDLVQIDK